MIRYALVCQCRHEFQSWFADSGAYETQAARGLVTCPDCGSSAVEKAIMAPNLKGVKKHPPAPVNASPAASSIAMISPEEREFRTKLRELRDHITKNADYVGPKFPEEARKMHYGEIEHRSIFGEASPEDAQALHEEGIELHPIPILPDDRN